VRSKTHPTAINAYTNAELSLFSVVIDVIVSDFDKVAAIWNGSVLVCGGVDFIVSEIGVTVVVVVGFTVLSMVERVVVIRVEVIVVVVETTGIGVGWGVGDGVGDGVVIFGVGVLRDAGVGTVGPSTSSHERA